MNMKIVTFGEIMLRLKSPGYDRLFQGNTLEATFGGGEANVAVSLANYGLDAAFVSVLPTNDIGTACIRELRGFGVDTTRLVRKEGRMGIYYLETGAVQRPSKVIYDRAGSTLCEAKPGDIDWKAAFQDAGWLHLTGITPAISQGAADLSLEAVKAAKEMGLHVSCDLNYRKNLWKYGKTADQVMTELVKNVETIIANEEDFQKSLGLKAESQADVEEGELNIENYKAIAALAMETYPNIKRVA
ncbi:MAG: sugar kinase, partial [Clostridia bacterium]|nr:sugar kinase [Clostridia bacterium]